MSKFKQLILNILLNESSIIKIPVDEAKQVGKLYHATTLSNCLAIIEENELTANPKVLSNNSHVLDLNSIGISTSRNKLFMYKGDIEIILDGDKLSNKYNLIPYNYFYDHNNSEMTHAEKRNTAETIIISSQYLKFAKDNIYNYDEVFYNPFSIPNIQDYIIGFMVSPSIFASPIMVKYLKKLLELSNKPLYTYDNKQINLDDFKNYKSQAKAKGKFSRIREFENLQDVLDNDKLEKYQNLSQKERNLIIQKIEQKYDKPYTELTDIQLQDEIEHFLNKLYLTKDNYRF